MFDTNGTLLQRITSAGPLNSPWGVAIAPANWAAFGGALLVGNFGDGKINAFNLTTGAALGTLQDPTGAAIVNTGLWALIFGNGKSGGDPNTLYIAAGITGPDNKTHGLLAGIAPPAQILSIVNSASSAGTSIAPGKSSPSPGSQLDLPRFSPRPSRPPESWAPPSHRPLKAPPASPFNGTAAPILYASSSATSVIVPMKSLARPPPAWS